MKDNHPANQRKANKETLRSNIKNYIQHQIAIGAYQPGDRIVETQLARELNVSQAPVREAILELSTIGLLEERPYSGSYVKQFTADEIADIFDTRAFVEEFAARRAAQRITDDELAALEDVLRQMDENRDMAEFVRLDIMFHGMVMDAAGSPALKRAWSVLRMADWTYLCAHITDKSMEEMIAQHRTIYHHLKNHDASSAGAYMLLHIKGFGRELCARYTSENP